MITERYAGGYWYITPDGRRLEAPTFEAARKIQAEQPSLLAALEPIDPRDQVDRIPGVDAPCICEPGRKAACGWPFCGWKTYLREDT